MQANMQLTSCLTHCLSTWYSRLGVCVSFCLSKCLTDLWYSNIGQVSCDTQQVSVHFLWWLDLSSSSCKAWACHFRLIDFFFLLFTHLEKHKWSISCFVVMKICKVNTVKDLFEESPWTSSVLFYFYRLFIYLFFHFFLWFYIQCLSSSLLNLYISCERTDGQGVRY